MRIEYQLTAEDYEEVNRRHSRLRPWVMLWFVGLVGCMVLVADLIPARPDSAPPAPPNFMRDVLLPFLPWVVILIVIWAIVFRMVRVNWRKPWLRPARVKGDRFWMMVAAFTVEVAGFVILFVMAVRAQRAATTDPGASPVLSVLISLFPIAGFAVVVGIVLTRFRGVFRRGWESQPQMHHPYVAEIDANGIRLAGPLSRHEYRWEYFPGWVETPNVYVVYISPVAFQLFPKRAFVDDTQRAEFVASLRQMISQRTNAFPVIQQDARPLPPLPVAG